MCIWDVLSIAFILWQIHTFQTCFFTVLEFIELCCLIYLGRVVNVYCLCAVKNFFQLHLSHCNVNNDFEEMFRLACKLQNALAMCTSSGNAQINLNLLIFDFKLWAGWDTSVVVSFHPEAYGTNWRLNPLSNVVGSELITYI